MKQFFCDGDQLSMGRLIVFLSALTGLVVFSVKSFVDSGDIGTNTLNGCMWLIGLAIVGKAGSKVAENMKSAKGGK